DPGGAGGLDVERDREATVHAVGFDHLVRRGQRETEVRDHIEQRRIRCGRELDGDDARLASTGRQCASGDERRCEGGYAHSASIGAAVTPATRNVVRRDEAPATTSMADFAMPSDFATSSITAAFASPSMGGAVTAILIRPSWRGPIFARDARGWTRISN